MSRGERELSILFEEARQAAERNDHKPEWNSGIGYRRCLQAVEEELLEWKAEMDRHNKKRALAEAADLCVALAIALVDSGVIGEEE